jgi:hypothetical protein
MRRVCLLLLLIALPACSSDETFEPVGPSGPTVPSIGGTFTGPDMFHFERSDGQVFDCNGAFTIGTQIATTFTGTFLLADQRCSGGTIPGTVTSGTFSTDGAISFALTALGAEPVFVAAVFGCTYASGDRLMTGTLTATELRAESRTTMNCANGVVQTVFLRVVGTRSP